MRQLTAVILMVFVAWVAWRLVTYRMRRTWIAVDGGPRTPIRMMTQYRFMVTLAETLWHNFRARPRMMGAAILQVLRRPRV